MQAQVSQPKTHKKLSALGWLMLVALALLIIAAIATPNLLRSRMAADPASYARQQALYDAAKAEGSFALPQIRQVISTAEMALLVDDPAKKLEEATAITGRFGGYVESSQVWRAESGGSAQLTLRIPAVRLEEARLALRHIAKKVESEKSSANDVSAQAVDLDATLRNYRAEEQQYLSIMQRADTVKDTLDVAQKLSEVRGRIERTQAQRDLISRQVEMATLSLTLRSESITQVRWLPNFRQAWNDAAESMAGYIAAMTALVLYLPAVLAWFFTIVALLALAWRVLRWLWVKWFALPLPSRA